MGSRRCCARRQRTTSSVQASSAEDALQLVDEQVIDAVFMDLVMPGLCGEPAIREFARRHPDLPVIVLSSSENPSDVRRVLNAGASGYIPKSATAQTVVSALRWCSRETSMCRRCWYQRRRAPRTTRRMARGRAAWRDRQ